MRREHGPPALDKALALATGLTIHPCVALESEIDRAAPSKAGASRKSGAARPERLYDPIGSYGGTTIFRYAVIDGETYEFDYASGGGPDISLRPNQRYVSPGLIYSAPAPPPSPPVPAPHDRGPDLP